MSIGDLRARVILRDEICVISLVDRTHECRDVYGQAHLAADLSRLTLGHVRRAPGGSRFDLPTDCIAQCGQSNDRHAESANAGGVRIYLAGVRAGMRW